MTTNHADNNFFETWSPYPFHGPSDAATRRDIVLTNRREFEVIREYHDRYALACKSKGSP
jgi:hypothetical protein